MSETISGKILEKRITIADIARVASVHPGTVSKVLNDRTGTCRVSQETRKKIKEIANQLNFRPNFAAKSLINASTYTLGVCICSEDVDAGKISPYQADIVCGIEESANKYGYDVLLSGVLGKSDDFSRPSSKFLERRIDGLLLVSSPSSIGGVHSLASLSDKIIGIDIYDSIGIPCVNIDNKSACIDVVNYLVTLGHQNIAFIGSLSLPAGLEEDLRFQGYLEGLRQNKIDYRPSLAISGHTSVQNYPRIEDCCFNDGVFGTRQLLESNSQITAIMCMNDQVAAGAVASLVEYGKSIPRDVSVVGFDDSMLARYMNPRLTSVKHDAAEMGDIAVKMLLGLVEKETTLPKENILVKPSLVLRDSTGRVSVTV